MTVRIASAHGLDRVLLAPFPSATNRCVPAIVLVNRPVSRMAILEIVKGNSPGTRFELDGDRSVIGRSADCEVPLDVPAVSRRHAAILRERGSYYIEDLQSRNGTFLNDNRLTGRTPLGEGDRLLICDQEFRFYAG